MGGVTGAGPGVAQDRVADTEVCDVGPGFEHDPGEVGALTRGKGGRQQFMQHAGTDERFAWVDARGPDFDERLARPGPGA